ncbi:MAG: DMT family transporter [Balneolaceae bacterium]
MKKPLTAYGTEATLFTVALIWALNFTVVKASLQEFHPHVFNGLRFVCASAFLWAMIAAKGAWFRLHKEDIGSLLLVGFIGSVVYQWLFIIGMDFTTAANAAVLLGTIPIWIALFSHLFTTEKLTRLKAIGVLLAFGGVLLIIAGGKNPISFQSVTFVGDLLILCSASVWGVFTIRSKGFLTRYTPLQFSGMMSAIGTVVLLAGSAPWLGETEWSTITLPAYGGMIYSGTLSIGLAYLIWNNALHKVGAVKTAVFQNLVPVFGLLFGIVLLGESMTLLQSTGAFITISGIVFTRMKLSHSIK